MICDAKLLVRKHGDDWEAICVQYSLTGRGESFDTACDDVETKVKEFLLARDQGVIPDMPAWREWDQSALPLSEKMVELSEHHKDVVIHFRPRLGAPIT